MKLRKHLLTGFLSLVIVACSPESSPPAATTPAPAAAVAALQAAIAIPDPYAADIAEDILRHGGNAVDAAIATGLAMAVTYIDAGNIGGGGFMLIHHEG